MDTPELSLEEAQDVVSTKVHPRVTKESIEDKIAEVRYLHDGTGTFCIIQMGNTFEVHGYSKPADSRNYDAQVGERYAYENAFTKLWQLEGYLLCQRLSEGEFEPPASPEEAFPRGLATYRSHKIVTAGKIGGAAESDAGLVLSVGQFTMNVQWSYLDRVPEKALDSCIGGYFVQYEDGYQSWSPAAAFESGYERVDLHS